LPFFRVSKNQKKFRGFANSSSGDSKQSTSQSADDPAKEDNWKIIKTIDKIIPWSGQIDKSIKEPLRIIVLEVINPHRFWFALSEEFEKIKETMENMTNFYDKDGDHLKVEPKTLVKELYVAALYDKLWHRGLILSVLRFGKVRIFFLDFGTVTDVAICELRYLLEDFIELPAVAKRGVLSYVQPLEKKWSEEAIKVFKKNSINKKVNAKIFQQNQGDSSYFLGVMVGSGTDKKLLSQLLLEKSLATVDPDFLKKENLNSLEMSFSDYENGKHVSELSKVEVRTFMTDSCSSKQQNQRTSGCQC
jgi:Tudor domain